VNAKPYFVMTNVLSSRTEREGAEGASARVSLVTCRAANREEVVWRSDRHTDLIDLSQRQRSDSVRILDFSSIFHSIL
jgi:hypothetical protein